MSVCACLCGCVGVDANVRWQARIHAHRPTQGFGKGVEEGRGAGVSDDGDGGCPRVGTRGEVAYQQSQK